MLYLRKFDFAVEFLLTWIGVVNSFQPSAVFLKDSCHLIYSANEMTSFYISFNTVLMG